jgi:hypothetical protein
MYFEINGFAYRLFSAVFNDPYFGLEAAVERT